MMVSDDSLLPPQSAYVPVRGAECGIESETIAVDGKVLRWSYEAINDDANVDSHPAIMLVSAYIVERGLILDPYEVDSKTNEITALPAFIKDMALKGVVFAFDAISTKKNCSSHRRQWE
ncbi:hypothetical protein QUA16_24125, partial [Microcoleus sp. S13_C3]